MIKLKKKFWTTHSVTTKYFQLFKGGGDLQLQFTICSLHWWKWKKILSVGLTLDNLSRLKRMATISLASPFRVCWTTNALNGSDSIVLPWVIVLHYLFLALSFFGVVKHPLQLSGWTRSNSFLRGKTKMIPPILCWVVAAYCVISPLFTKLKLIFCSFSCNITFFSECNCHMQRA